MCHNVKNVEQQYIETKWLIEPEVDKLVSVFMAVSTMQTVHLCVQKVTQQQMSSAAGQT
jgi:hypothetical protein